MYTLSYLKYFALSRKVQLCWETNLRIVTISVDPMVEKQQILESYNMDDSVQTDIDLHGTNTLKLEIAQQN